MNDCLAATGSTPGLDPLIGALVLLLLGAGLAALAWRHRKRAAAGIALLPLALGVFLFSGLSGQSAQAAPCPPPAACVPDLVLEDFAVDGLQFDLLEDLGEIYPGYSGLTDDEADALFTLFYTLLGNGAMPTGGLTVSNDNGSVTLFVADDVGIYATEPALPDGFTLYDLYNLIFEELEPETLSVPAVYFLAATYDNGCGEATVTITLSGELMFRIA